MMSIDFKNIVILDINGIDYCWSTFGISQGEAINLLKSTDLSKKTGSF